MEARTTTIAVMHARYEAAWDAIDKIQTNISANRPGLSRDQDALIHRLTVASDEVEASADQLQLAIAHQPPESASDAAILSYHLVILNGLRSMHGAPEALEVGLDALTRCLCRQVEDEIADGCMIRENLARLDTAAALRAGKEG